MRIFFLALFLWVGLVMSLFYDSANAFAAPVEVPQNGKALSSPEQNKQNIGANASGLSKDDMSDIHDIKALSPVALPMSLTQILWMVFTGVLIFILAIAGWLYWRRRNRIVGPEVEILPPDTIAFQRLAEIENHGHLDDKAYYVVLSSIFREYIEGRYGIDGLEMTTEELLPSLDNLEMERELRQSIKAFVAVCDPVKFADVGVTTARREEDYRLIKMFVEKTKVSEEETEPEMLSGD